MTPYSTFCLTVVGFLFTSSLPAEDRIETWPHQATAALSFTFDDSTADHWSVAVPTLNARDIDGTFFVITNTMDTVQVLAAAEAGHEIGSHVTDGEKLVNGDNSLSATAESRITSAIASIQSALASYQSDFSVRSLAYPYGLTSRESDGSDLPTVVSSHHGFARTAGGAVMAASTNDWAYRSNGSWLFPRDNGDDSFLARYWIGISKNVGANEGASNLSSHAESVVTSGGWGVLLYHNVSATNFPDQVDAVLEHSDSLWIAPFSDVAAYCVQRDAAGLSRIAESNDQIELALSSPLTEPMLQSSLSLSIEVPWSIVQIEQDNLVTEVESVDGSVVFDARVNGGSIFLTDATEPKAAPTDNPIAGFYVDDPHSDDYAWTDELAWDAIFDIRDYGGAADGNSVGDGVGVTDNVAAFQIAVDAAYNAGGGVVYIPAGVWYFGDHIYLKDGVVVRGETPSITDAQDDQFSPPTRLEFPRYFFDPTANDGNGTENSTAFKFIQVDDNGNSGNLGLVYLDINRAGVSLAADGNGTRNRLVFGIRNNNVAAPDTTIPQRKININDIEVDFQHGWQRHSWRFVRNIICFAQENVLVANNRINDKHYRVDFELNDWETVVVDDFIQPGYIIQDTKRAFGNDNKALIPMQEEHLPLFSYTNHYGIHARGGSSTWGAAPWEGPSLFRSGTTVRDNWVYTTMRVGYHLSGYGLKVLNNIKKDRPDKVWWLHPAGKTSLSGAQTLENRGMDIAGSRILVEGNWLEAERHRVNNGGYFSTDGEGLLVQECCGGTTLDDITIRNNTVNAYIGLYKMPYTRNILIEGNTLTRNFTGPANIYVNANKNGTQAPLFDIFIQDNTFENAGSIELIGSSGGGGIEITGNTMNGGKIRYPDSITFLDNNTGFSTLEPDTVGSVRDYPILELEDPSDGGILMTDGSAIQLKATIPGTFLIPEPQSEAELPTIVQVDFYANETKIGTLSSPTSINVTPALVFEQEWTPTPGYYQLSARAEPQGYVGPTGSTAWFTVSEVIPIRVFEEIESSPFADWLVLYFPDSTDPAVIGDKADPDWDGLPNMMEYGLGSDPTKEDPRFKPALMRGPDFSVFQFSLRDDLETSIVPKLLQSSDLETWTELDLADATALTEVEGDPAGVTFYEMTLSEDSGKPVIVRLIIERTD